MACRFNKKNVIIEKASSICDKRAHSLFCFRTESKRKNYLETVPLKITSILNRDSRH